MTAGHVLFVPAMLLIGFFVGYVVGARAVRDELARKEAARKR